MFNDDKGIDIPIIWMELKEIIQYVYSKLDYNIRDYETRKQIIVDIEKEVGEQLNAYLYFCLDHNLNDYKISSSQQHLNNLMEVMTEYLLNAKDIHKNSEYPYVGNNRLKDTSQKKNISLERYMEDILSADGNIYKHYDDNNNATYKIEDFVEDLQNCGFIWQYVEYNKIARQIISIGEYNGRKYNDKEISILKKSIGYCKNNSIEIDKDIISLYKIYKGYIYFKQPLKETTAPSFEYFDFDNVNQVMALLKFKGGGNFDSDLGCLIYDLNQIVSRIVLTKRDSNILRYYRKFDMTLEDIANEFGVSKQYISQRLQNVCRKIAKQFWVDYEDWYYTYMVKGKYKKCGICGRVLLLCDNNFSPDKRNKDGYQSNCKECRKTYTRHHLHKMDTSQLK